MSRNDNDRSIERPGLRGLRVRANDSRRRPVRSLIHPESLERRVVMTMPGADLGMFPKLESKIDPITIAAAPIVAEPPPVEPPAPPVGPIGGQPLPPKPGNDPSEPVPSRTEVVVAVPVGQGYDALVSWATSTEQGTKYVDWAGSFRLFDQGQDRIVVLKLKVEQNPQPVLNALQSKTFVSWAAPNLVYPADSGFDPRDFVPNDPLYGIQWHHPLMGNTQAWDSATTMGSGVTIAILDDGVRLNHEDLAANIWRNTGEIPGNGVDDDGNGYADDVNGWNFVANTNNPNPTNFGSHGTPVAGSAAAVTNNSVGVAGVAGKATILPVKFYDYGAWTSVMIAQSYAYAVNNGAKIMNVSYNIDGFAADPIYAAASNYVYDAGVLYTNSAGNNGQLNPARTVYDQALFVVATGTTDGKMSYSNYGVAVDISAPADPLYTTSDATAGGGYEAFNGTSAATPVASGAFALVWGQHPTWTREQVVAQVLGTADNIDAANPGLAGLLGYGRINTYKALTQAIAAPKFGAITGLPSEGGISTRPIGGFTMRTASIYDPSTIAAGSFQMQSAGPDRVFGNGDDVYLPVAVEALNGGTYKIGTNDLKFSVGGSMVPGLYRFIAKSGPGGVTDPFGQYLDGNRDGTAGDDFVRNFEVVYQAGGVVYREDNRDGARQATEPGLGGWIVMADGNGDGLVSTTNYPLQTSPNVPVGITDNTTVGSNLAVAGVTAPILSVRVKINLTHTWNSDMIISLVAPSGTRVQLANRRGGSNDNYTDTIFDDSAALSIAQGAAPFTGSFRPEQSLSALFGQSANGTWRLEVQDVASGDVGQIVSWGIELSTSFDRVVTTTAADGSWVASGLPTGNHVFGVILPNANWSFGSPVDGMHSFSLPTISSTAGGIDYGVIGRPTLSASVDGGTFSTGDTMYFTAIWGQSSALKTVTITNAGPGTALFGGATLPPEFRIIGTLPTMLLPGKSASFQMIYDGTNPLDVNGELRLAYLDGQTPADYVFKLAGDTIAPSFSGSFMADLNANGTLDTGERAFSGVKLYADLNNNGSYTAGTPSGFAATGLPGNLVDSGVYTKSISVSGVNGLIEKVTVGVNLTHTYISDLYITLISPTGVRTVLFNQRGGSSANMTNTVYDDAAALAIGSGTPPYTGTFRPEEPLSRYNGTQANGTWTLEVSDLAALDTGQLLNFSLSFVTGGEPIATTDAQGHYEFYDLPSGNPLSVRILSGMPAGHTVINPVGGVYSTTLNPSQYVPLNYVTLPTNSISGQVTALDTGSGVGRVRIYDDVNGNGQFDFTPVQPVSTATPVRIRDMGTVSKTVSVSGSSLPVQGVEVTVNIAHSHVGDLRITLISPGGTQVQLLNRQGSNAQNLVNTVFDEYAAGAVPSGVSLSGGRYTPSQSLSSLFRTNPNGTWTLRVEDLAYGDVGTFNSFSLRLITSNEATTVTNALGFYTLASAAAGAYNLRPAPIDPGWTIVNPVGGIRTPSLVSGSAVNGQNFVLERAAIESATRSVPVTIASSSGGRTDSFGVSYGIIAVPPPDLVNDVALSSQNGSRASNRRIVNM